MNGLATRNDYVRFLIRRDLNEVVEIERQSFEFAWTEEDFLTEIRTRNVMGYVVEHDLRIVGYMIYELLQEHIHILNFAVAPWCRRQGVGRSMVEKLINKLSQQRRQAFTLEIRESNLAAQLFFREQGLKAREVVRGHYEDTDEDGYLFEYRLGEQMEAGTGRMEVRREW